MEMDLYTIEKEIEEYMSSLGWDEYRKVEKRIKAARASFREALDYQEEFLEVASDSYEKGFQTCKDVVA